MIFIVSGILLLVFFALSSRYIKQGGMRDTDFAVTVKIQERIDTSSRLRAARLVGEVMEGSTFLASPEVSVIAVLVITVVAAFDRKKKRIRWTAVTIPIVFALLVLGEMYGKNVVHHPAPPFFMIKNPATIFPKYYINDEFSYPSGHAARAMFLAMILWFITKKKKLGTLLTLGLYVGLVGLSRLYLGHHWLSDVFGGVLLGSACALLGAVVL